MAQDSDVARVAAALKAPGLRYRSFGNEPVRAPRVEVSNVTDAYPLLGAAMESAADDLASPELAAPQPEPPAPAPVEPAPPVVAAYVPPPEPEPIAEPEPYIPPPPPVSKVKVSPALSRFMSTLAFGNWSCTAPARLRVTWLPMPLCPPSSPQGWQCIRST